MPTLKITILVTDGTNQQEQEVTLDIDKIRGNNPRQAISAYTKAMVNKAMEDAGINFSI